MSFEFYLIKIILKLLCIVGEQTQYSIDCLFSKFKIIAFPLCAFFEAKTKSIKTEKKQKICYYKSGLSWYSVC